MDIIEFNKSRIEGREQLLEKIVTVFKSLNPVAIHQFGSGSKGFKDEFSDIDIWVTFNDEDIKNILKVLTKTFNKIAPILIRHHSKSWSPISGSSNSIIHEVNSNLFVVDYYISKFSETIIKSDSEVLFGDNTIKRGEWRLNKDYGNKIHDSHTMRKDINLMVDLIFISVKGIVRKWKDDSFLNILKRVHRNFRKKYKGIIKRRQIRLDFRSDKKILSDLYLISNQNQRRAINKIRKYIGQVEQLYSN